MNQKVRVEKTDNRILVKIGNKLLFRGDAFQAKGKVHIRDVHGHCRIRERLYPLVRLPHDRMELVSNDPVVIKFEGSKEFNRLFIELGAFPKERMLGGGEQYSRLNLKGRRFPIFVQEQGIGRGWNAISLLAALKGVRGSWYSTYFPQPVFLSSAGYGVIVDTTATVIADFRRRDRTTLEIWDNYCNLVVLEGSLEEMVRRFHQLYGSKPVMEDWIFGVWLASQGGISTADRTIKTAKKWSIPLTALWCQDWSGKNITKFGRQVYWNWSYDSKDYVNLPVHIQRWKEEGIQFLGYINPFLVKGGPLYREARDNGFLVKKKNGEVYDVVVTTFPAGMVDLSNPEAYRWYKEIIKHNMVGIGMSGWMADYGEYLPVDARLMKGSGLEYHNRYVLEWAKLNAEAVEETESNAIFFMRAGYLGSTKYTPSYWAGDQNVDWSKSDGLPSVIPAMISMGICGVKLPHFDAGGYTSVLWMKRTPELFMRWVEMAAFSPIMRIHQTNRPSKNVQFDSNVEILRHFSKMTRVHYEIKDYLKHCLEASILENLPMVRHLAIHYPEDPKVWNIQYQYLLGRDLLVAPVIRPGVRSWKVYLPKDRWVHVWSEKRFEGGWVEVEVPLGKPPVFVREDSHFTSRILALKYPKIF